MQVGQRPSLLAQAQAQLDADMPPSHPLPPVEAYSDAPVPKRPPGGVSLLCAADVLEQPIHWLWDGWIARGKLSILAGAAGTGKTTLALGLAATVTTGGAWPDGVRCIEPGNVLVWSSEDDPADTLKPRLMACGANVRRVFFVRGVTDPATGEILPFDPARDIPTLHAAVTHIGGASLLVVDPIISAVAGDMHRANDVRRGLQAVVDFAAAYNCAIVGITHFSKGSAGTSPQERVIGSQAFAAFARTVLVAAKQEDCEGRVLARAKSNISIDDGGVTYFIEPCSLDSAIQTTRVAWGEKVEGSARDILGAVEAPQTEETSEEEDAAKFLRDLLVDGPVSVKQVKADAFGAGYAWRTIERAKKTVGVDAVKLGMKEGWVWKLAPEDRQESPKTATSFSGGLREKLAVFGGADNPEGAQEIQKMLTPKREHLLENLSAFKENPNSEAEVGQPTKDEEF